MQSPVAKLVKNPPANIQSLDREDLLEEEIATHSSILPWKIPWPEESGMLQSKQVAKRLQRVRED